jgi:hypothetical protein
MADSSKNSAKGINQFKIATCSHLSDTLKKIDLQNERLKQ